MRWIISILLVLFLTTSVIAGEKDQLIQLLDQKLKTLEWEGKWLQERLNVIFPKSLQDEIIILQKRVKAIQVEYTVIKKEIEKLKTYVIDATKEKQK